MKKELQDRLHCTCTNVLMCVKNILWKNHPTNEQNYVELPPITATPDLNGSGKMMMINELIR